MNAPMTRKLAFTLLIGLSACDEAEGFELPQILPGTNVLCVSYDEVPVGDRSARFAQLSNLGRQTLEITETRIEDDTSGVFAIDQLRTESLENCDLPCSVPTDRSVYLRFFYEPAAPGWDTATLRVLSNAENFPRLPLFILAKARPANLPEEEEYDAGPKPDNARDDEGNEACPED